MGVYFRNRAFRLTGAPASLQASSAVIRTFCRACGGPLSFQFADTVSDQILGVTVGSLDRPDAFAPTRHNWTSSQLSWNSLRDGLPRNPGHAGDETGA